MHHTITLTLLWLLLSLATMTTGCATVMNPPTVAVPVYTDPPGAKLYVSGGGYYTSPAVISLPRGQGDFIVKITKKGYEPGNVLLHQSLDAWLWGNVMLGGLIGLAIDLSSGRGNDLEPETVNYTLVKKDEPEEAGITKKPQEIVQRYRLRAEQRSASDQYDIGLMYARGIGVPRDYVQAYLWLSLAAAQGHNSARKYRDKVDKEMTLGQAAKAHNLVHRWKSRKSR